MHEILKRPSEEKKRAIIEALLIWDVDYTHRSNVYEYLWKHDRNFYETKMPYGRFIQLMKTLVGEGFLEYPTKLMGSGTVRTSEKGREFLKELGNAIQLNKYRIDLQLIP